MNAIALLGAGTMGTALGRRLLATGHRLTVWNRTPGRTRPLVEAGARAAATPAEAVRDADVVITMLTDATAVRETLFGADAAACALRPGTHLVEMSTIGPHAVGALAARLPPDVPLVDAPVGGSAGAAEAGRLVVLAGGAEEAVDRVAPVLATLGTIRRCGGSGRGAAMKLVLNTALVTAVTAVADALAVADAVGVDRRTACEALANGPLGGAVARATTTEAAFAVALAAKDARLALDALSDVPAPVLRAAASVLAAAPRPDADIATLADARTVGVAPGDKEQS
ncbi:NAD(P)-binding domain-containing protein [Micromonospora sp. DR5-3]|uniref:NAD(P)-dependent oxidoreductase n=1 Tax=unclassified Micromonospora TaxID=2617518 RepID=UPI0011D7736F|nr:MULTISPECIES: NAD(P)-binding domain-containing protein [unclassified Micromonospora]MCW3816058.1 NAD(P)-binding domain-containing protein [Micromonospora sp. DR5-3]TYC21266.1 NAD(P)-dependent oxidoreductase [Micromonospora sp. MP36]